MSEGEKLIPINIEDEMKSAYDYSMSVIVSRADVRDGLNQYIEEFFTECMI
jgi:DNA gyrase subunit A